MISRGLYFGTHYEFFQVVHILTESRKYGDPCYLEHVNLQSSVKIVCCYSFVDCFFIFCEDVILLVK